MAAGTAFSSRLACSKTVQQVLATLCREGSAPLAAGPGEGTGPQPRGASGSAHRGYCSVSRQAGSTSAVGQSSRQVVAHVVLRSSMGCCGFVLISKWICGFSQLTHS